MKDKYLKMYMQMAEIVAQQSYAERKKVGCVIVSPQDLVTYGWNGQPSGWDNCCEEVVPGYIEYYFNSQTISLMPKPKVATKKTVLHAESNALMKAAREGFSLKGSTMFCTCSPCIDCAKLIHQAGIESVYYKEVYRSTEGIEFLEKCKISVIKLGEEN